MKSYNYTANNGTINGEADVSQPAFFLRGDWGQPAAASDSLSTR